MELRHADIATTQRYLDMDLILEPEQIAAWLDPKMTTQAEVEPLMKPWNAAKLTIKRLK